MEEEEPSRREEVNYLVGIKNIYINDFLVAYGFVHENEKIYKKVIIIAEGRGEPPYHQVLQWHCIFTNIIGICVRVPAQLSWLAWEETTPGRCWTPLKTAQMEMQKQLN